VVDPRVAQEDHQEEEEAADHQEVVLALGQGKLQGGIN